MARNSVPKCHPTVLKQHILGQKTRSTHLLSLDSQSPTSLKTTTDPNQPSKHWSRLSKKTYSNRPVGSSGIPAYTQAFSGCLPINARLPVNAHLIFLYWGSRTNASISLQNGRSLVFPFCGENGR